MPDRPGDRFRDLADRLKGGRNGRKTPAEGNVRIPPRQVDQVLTQVGRAAELAATLQEAHEEDALTLSDVKTLQEALGKALFKSIQVEEILDER